MKKTWQRLGLPLALLALLGTASAADVGVSVSVSQPRFYGRIDVGRSPPPVLIYAQPVVVQQLPVAVVRQPIYLRVPPAHERDWGKHCRHYSACGQPVYFVQDIWYRDVYAPRYSRGSERRDDVGRGHHKRRKDHGEY